MHSSHPHHEKKPEHIQQFDSLKAASALHTEKNIPIKNTFVSLTKCTLGLEMQIQKRYPSWFKRCVSLAGTDKSGD